MIAPNASRRRLLWIVSLLAVAQTAILTWLIFAFRVELNDKIAAHCQCRLVFLGDSLTADGGVWGWRLGRWWPDNRNFGRPGADLYVVRSVVDEVVPALRPECVVLMTGVNDFGRGHDAARVIRDYDGVIDRVRATKEVKSIVIISTLYLRDGRFSTELDKLNEALSQRCERDGMTFLDLRPTLCSDGRLREEFSRDVVHFRAFE